MGIYLNSDENRDSFFDDVKRPVIWLDVAHDLKCMFELMEYFQDEDKKNLNF